ncbi:MAG: neutral zinc metallopeptidase [Bacteroidales bacterium]|nr:neutral zinc metallopeptidase [Bacteroidales bacterium]
MNLEGRRTSSNVDDRRSVGGGKVAGMGIGGIAVIALITWLLGGNPLSVISQADLGGMMTTQAEGNREFTKEEQELATFASQILASTEDVWTKLFKQMGKTYNPPTMVLFTDAVRSGCGNATSQSGPFYCSADRSVYIDLSFFSQMKNQMGAGGDFAYAYVIAHEVGHHVQNELGILQQVNNVRARSNEKVANEYSVRLELQADFFAGIWGYYENKMYGSLEKGDVEEAVNCAGKIGDDFIQKQAYGRTVPDSFTHGTSEQRTRWLYKGLSTGDLNQMDTFNIAYNSL